MLNHAVPPLAQHPLVSGISRQVVQFRRILRQVKKLLVAVVRVENVLPLTVGQGVPVVFHAVAHVVLQVNGVTPARVVPAHQVQQAAAVDGAGYARAGRVEKGWQYIPELYWLGDSLSPTVVVAETARPAQEHGNVRRALVRVGFAPQVVIAQHVAVVGEEDDQCVVVPASFFQHLQDATNFFVQEGHVGVVPVSRAFGLVHTEIAVPQTRIGWRLVRRKSSGPLAHVWSRHVGIRVHVPEAGRWVVRTVRAFKRDFEQERLRPIVLAEEIHGVLADPVGWVKMLWQDVRPGAVVVPSQARRVGVFAWRDTHEPAVVVADEARRLHPAGLVQQRAVKTVQTALRVPVHFADAEGVVSGLAHQPRELGSVVACNPSVAQHAVVPGGEPCEQAGAGGSTGRRGAVGVREHDSFARDRIQVGCVNGRVAHAAEAVETKLVCHQEQDVRSGGGL